MNAAFLNTTQVFVQLRSSNGDFIMTFGSTSLLNSCSCISISAFSSVGDKGAEARAAGRISSFEPVLGTSESV